METQKWFVLRDLKRPNAKNPAWKMLPELSFEVFTPMRERLREVGGRKIRETVPVLADLLFVKSTAPDLDEVMLGNPTLQYRFMRGFAYRTPMTVPDAEMETFIKAVKEASRITYYLPDELTPDMCGREIRVVDGPMQGHVGKILKLRGRTKPRLLVQLNDILIAAVEIDRNYIEFV